MFVGLKIALSAALLFDAHSACLAQKGGVPNIDVHKMCRENQQAVQALSDVNDGSLETCLADEQKAREQIVQEWATYPPLAKTRCVQVNSFLPNYIEWLTCLEMTRDVIKMRKEQSAVTPSRSKTQAKERCPVVEVGDDGNIKSVVACNLD